MRKNEPKMILTMDEYNNLLNDVTRDSKMGICLLSFIINVMTYGGTPFLLELEKQMTKAGYELRYYAETGLVSFGKGDKIIVFKPNK